MPAELTDEGAVASTLAEIVDEIDADLRADIHPSLNLSSTSAIGVLRGVVAERLKSLQDFGVAIYGARNPSSATGDALSQLALLTGTERRAATKARGTATVNIDAGASFAVGELIASVTGDESRRMVNTEEVENTGGTPDDFDIEFEAETAGAAEVLAGTLEVIAEPQTGWNSITNAEDFTPGEDEETNEELRQRREDELTAQGSTNVDAIRADILEQLGSDAVEGGNITHCTVLENDTDLTDGNGQPLKSIQVIARGLATDSAAADELADVILDSKPSGIRAYGTTTRTRADSQGNSHNIGLSWVADVDIYIEADLTVDDDYPADGDAQVKAAIAAVGAAYAPGDDVIAERLKAACFTVAGVIDVTALRLGTAPSPVGTANIAITQLQIGDLDTSRVTVNS